MTAPGYLVRSAADVPAGDGWLGSRERAVQGGLRLAVRRDAWRLGRWTAKSAVGAWLGIAQDEVEILAAADGAPEPWAGEERLPVALSLSHRAGLGLAVAGPRAPVLGCDVELVEPRSPAFQREWFAPAERSLLATAAAGQAADLTANLLWTAKEAATKVRRAGLRLDVRHALVELGDGDGRTWSPLTVTWPDAAPARGWWRAYDGHVLTIAADRPIGAPRCLDGIIGSCAGHNAVHGTHEGPHAPRRAVHRRGR